MYLMWFVLQMFTGQWDPSRRALWWAVRSLEMLFFWSEFSQGQAVITVEPGQGLHGASCLVMLSLAAVGTLP